MTPLASRISPASPSFLRKKKEKARHYGVEVLEPRVVPAANMGAGMVAGSLSAAQVDTVVTGLESLNLVLHDADLSTTMASFAGLEKGAGGLFGLGSANGTDGFLGDAFRDRFNAAFPAAATVADVNAFLQAGPGAGPTGAFANVGWNFIQGGSYSGAHPFEWELKISGDRATTVAAKLEGDVTFDIAPLIPVTASGDVTFSFGLDANGGFFSTLGATQVRVLGSQNAPAGKVDFGGGHKFNITGGAVAVDSTAALTLVNSEAADGILTGAELATLHAANTPGQQFTQSGDGLNARYRLSTATEIVLQQASAAPHGAMADVAFDLVFTAGIASAYDDLFAALQTAGAALDENPFYTEPLPGLNGSIKDLTPIDDIFRLADEAHTYLTLTGPSLRGLAGALTDALPASFNASFTTSFDPAAGTLSLALNLLSGEIRSQVDFDRFGDAASSVGLTFDQDESLQFDFTAAFSGSLGVKIDLASKAVTATPAIDVSAGFTANDINVAAILGPLSAGVTHGSASLTAALALGGVDLDVTELAANGAITLTGSGAFAASLPLDVSFGGTTLAGAQIELASANVFTTPVKFNANLPSFDKVFSLGRLTPGDVLDFIVDAGAWAKQFADSPIFSTQIPFTGSTLGEVADFGALFASNLKEKISAATSSVGTQKDFAAFTLTAPVNFVLQTAAGSETVELPAGTYPTLLAYKTALNEALAGTGYSAVDDSSGKVRITHAGEEPFVLNGAASNLFAIGFLSVLPASEATGAAVNSAVLAADARFMVSVDGSAPVAVTVPASSTTSNASLADLAADVQTALGSGFAVTVANGTLHFARADGLAFLIAPDTGSAALGLGASLAAGLVSKGATTVTEPLFRTINDLMPLLADALGLPEQSLQASFDLSTLTFTFSVALDYTGPSLDLPVGLNLQLGDLASLKTVDADGNLATPTLSIVPHLSGQTTFGFTLQGAPSFEELTVSPDRGFAPAGYNLNASGGPNPESAKTWNGRLASDAALTFSFDDGVKIPLIVPASATSTNATAADLAADVNAAIAANAMLAGKIGARVQAGNGGTADRLEFFTKAQTAGFQIRTFEVQASGSASASTGLGFRPGALQSASSPSVAVTNQPGAIDHSPGTDAIFKITVDGGDERTITIPVSATAANTTLPDLLADINAAIAADSQLAGKVRAVRVGAGSQFVLLGSAEVKTLRVDADGSAVSALGFADDPATVRTKGAQFFLDNTSVQADATISVDDFRVAAQLGFLSVTTGPAAGSIVFTAKAELKDGAQTRFGIGELFDRVGQGTLLDIVEKDFTGTADVSLTGLKVDGGLLALTTGASIEIHSDNLFAAGGPAFTVDIEGLPADVLAKLQNFSSLKWQDIYEGIRAGIDLLAQTEQFAFLKETKIPVLELSLGDVFTYGDKLVSVIDELENNPAGVLQTVEAQIEQILGIPAEAFSLTLEDGSIVKMHLGIRQSFSEAVGLNFNLQTISELTNDAIPADLLSLGGFLDVSSEGNINFSGFAGVDLDLGIDVSGATPKFIAYQTSGVTLGFRAVGQNLNLNASLGPIGIGIREGLVLLDSDGVLDANDDGIQEEDFATIKFGPKADYDIGQAITDIRGGASLGGFFGLTYQGTLTAELPAAITSPIGEIELPSPIELRLLTISGLFNHLPNAVNLTLPSFDGLIPEIPGLLQLLRDPAILLDGVDSGLALVQKTLDSKVSTKLPIIGDQLAAGARFIEDFRGGFLSELTDKLRGAGDNLLGTLQEAMFGFFDGDLGLLLDYNGDSTVTKDDIVLTFRHEDGTIWNDGEDPRLQDAVQFNFHLGQSITLGTDLSVDFGVPGLALDIQGSPEITAGWDLFLGFGVSVTDYFYLDVAPPEAFSVAGDGVITSGPAAAHELSLGFNAVLTSDPANPFHAKGTLFFLQLDADDKLVNNEFSHLSGSFFVDLADPGVGAAADGRLTPKELFAKGGAIKPLSAGLEAEAVVNLSLAASVGGSAVIPRVLTDFNLGWSFVAGQPISAPEIGFTNARMDLGSFVTDFLKPILGKVNDVLDPLDPVLDALQTRLPVLSDFLGRDYTVLDLASDFGKVDRRFVDAILQVRQIVGDIAALPDGVSIEVPIGSLTGLGSALMSKDGAKGVSTAGLGNTTISIPAGNATQNQYRDTFNKTTSVTGGGFGFPILQPANAFKLLLGQDATLVTYDLPRLEVGLSLRQSFAIYPPLFGTFSGSLSAYADLAFGFDTKGFNTFRTSGDPLDVLDGFFVSDRANADGTGADVSEAGFKGRIGIGGELNVGIARGGVEGFFELSADLDLNDPNDDGKIRGSEIIALVNLSNGFGPLNLASLDLKGEVGARAYVDVFALFGYKTVFEKEFLRTTLFETHFAAPAIQPNGGQIISVNGENVLTLNAGPTANKRELISTTDVGEEFVIGGSGKNLSVTFTNTGHTTNYTNVDRVVMNGGKGNDRLIVGAGVTTAFTFDGGEGDDEFQGGDGDDVVFGGVGNDIIRGGGGKNTLDGGVGADQVLGGAGNDIVIGGDGDDTIDGGGGNDTFKFADHWGRDTLVVADGSPGARAFNLAATNANLSTGSGTFDFSAVTANLTLNVSSNGASGSAGNNTISYLGGGYITKLLGGSGNDTAIIASSGSTEITVDGGAGDDQSLVTFGRLNATVHLVDSSGGNDLVQIAPLTGGFSLAVGQHDVIGTKPNTARQHIQFGDGFENLTVDAKNNGGSALSLSENLNFSGDVRLAAKTAQIENTINAGAIRLETSQQLSVGANLNAKINGAITVVAGGDITLNGNLLSSAGGGFTGDGSGLIHLLATGGGIKTGINDDGSTPRVIADFGSLLLRGTGSIGTATVPIYTQIATLAASSTGLINLSEANGLVVGEIASISGIKTGKADVTIFNDSAELRAESPIVADGSNHVTLTSDSLQINADITNPKGTVVLQPKGTTTGVAIGEDVDATFDLSQSEITHLQDGFYEILLGRNDAKALAKIGNLAISDPVVLRNPLLGAHVSQTGVVTGTDNAMFAIIGSGHTTELNNQSVPGEINIGDSAVIRDGETVTLESQNSNVFLNFRLDGSAGLGVETLNLAAPNGQIVIKGNIGSEVKLGVLHVTAASSVRFEGTVRVGQLIIDDGATFVVDGLIDADSVTVAGVDSSTFDSGLNVSGALNVATTAGLVFKGGVQSGSLTVDGGTLVDFYQNVTTGVASVKANGASGDATFRQGFTFTSGTVTVADDATLIGGVTGTTLTLTAADIASFQAATTLGSTLNATATSIVFANGAALDGGAITLITTKANVGEVRFTGNVQPDSLKITSARPVNFQAAIEVGTLDVTGKSVLVEGTLDVTNGSFDIAGDLRFVSQSNFTTLGITNAVNTTFEGLLGVTGAIAMNGSGATRFEGATKAASFDVTATQQIFAGSSLEATSGDLTLKSLEIDFGGGSGSVKGSVTSTLNLVPDTATTTVDIGSPTPSGTLDISDADLNAIKASFAKVVIGRPDSTADFVVGSSRFNGNFVLQGGNVSFEENTVSLQDVRATGNFDVQSKGTITVNDDIFAKAITFTAANGLAIHSTLNGTTGTLTATTGNIGFDAALNFTGAAALTATTGNILFSADLKGSSVNLQTPLGQITQTGGRTITPDVFATAKAGLTLLTRTDHISASVTGTGALDINDDNAAPHVLHLGGSATTDRLFTADGDITVVALGDLAVDRVQANGRVNLTANRITVTNLTGSPATITGTTIVSANQNSGGQPIIYQGDILLMNDLTFDSDGGDITITGRVLSNTGAEGLTVVADGGKVLIGGGDLEYLAVQGASTFTLNGAVKSTLDFTVEAGAIAITAPKRSIITTSGALHFQPLTNAAAIDIGRDSAGFSLNDAELLAFGDGWRKVEIGRATGDHAVQIESAQFVDDVTIRGDSIALLASSTRQSVNGISVVNGNEKNHLFLLAQSSFTQGKRAGISAGGDVTIVADTMALDTTAANGIRGFGTLDLHTHTAGLAVTLGNAPEAGELHFSPQELAAINSSFAAVKIGSANSGVFKVTHSLTFQNDVELISGANLEVVAGPSAALTLFNSRGRDLGLRAAGDITVEASLRTAGRGDISVIADSDGSGAGALTWALVPTKAQPVQKAVTVSGDLTLSGASVQLGTATLPPKNKAPVWAFESKSGSLSIDADTSAITNGAITARNVLIDALAQNSLVSTSIKAFAAVRLHAAPATGVVSLDAKTNISALASILVEAGQFNRGGAKLKSPLITTP